MNPAPATAAHPAAILAIILASYFMILLDNSVIFTALPGLQADLQLGTGELAWVQDAYTLVFGGLLLLGARGGDRRARRFDLFGALSATLGVGALVFGIINTADAGWASPATGTAVTAGIVLLVVFVLIKRRAAQPIMPLRLFASRRRAGAYVARFLYLGAMIAFFFFTTQFLQEVLGFDPLQAGMGFLPMTAVNFAVAMSIPRLVNRMPGSIPLVAGILITLAGMFWLSRVGVDSSYLTGVAFPMVLIGAGQGLAFAPLTSFGIVGAPAADAGAASALVNTFHQVGTCLGLGIAVAAAATVPAAGSAAAHLAAQVSAALTTGSVLLLLALAVTAALILPADLAARRVLIPLGAAPAPLAEAAR